MKLFFRQLLMSDKYFDKKLKSCFFSEKYPLLTYLLDLILIFKMKCTSIFPQQDQGRSFEFLFQTGV